LLADVQRMVTPELTRVFGQHGLFLRPTGAEPTELSGNMLGHVLSLHRQGEQLAGQLRCSDAELPLCSGSVSLVYSLFMLERCQDPQAMLQEVARVLKPEGTALLISLNPWSLAQFHWSAPGRMSSASLVGNLALEAGLEVVRMQFVGPFWPAGARGSAQAPPRRWYDRFRAASLLVCRHREAALTPLRKAPSTVSLRPGMSAG
jgi:SAM-dependent methyltransferase